MQFLHVEEDFAWDNPWNNQLYRNDISVYFFEKHNGWNQLWYLHRAAGENRYYIQSAQTGQYIHVSRSGSGFTLVTRTGKGGAGNSGGDSLLSRSEAVDGATVFTARSDESGNITWYAGNRQVFDLSGGHPGNGADLQLWEPNSSNAQKFYINIPSVQPEVIPGVFTHIRNGENNGLIHIESGPVKADASGDDALLWYSGMWTIEPDVDGSFRLKNRWKGTYLHIENGVLESSDIPAGSWSSNWNFIVIPGTDYVRIQNKWKPDLYLQNKSGSLTCSAISTESKGSYWILQYIGE